MTTLKSIDLTRDAIRSKIAAISPSLNINETEVARQGGRYFVLEVGPPDRPFKIYVCDDGDLGLATEDGRWFPVEVWDEIDSEKRIERIVGIMMARTELFSAFRR